MYELFLQLAELVHNFGYLGIFVMTLIESTFIPIPSEVTVIPAGFLVAQGKLSLILTLLTTVAGTLAGSLLNYTIARKFGRHILINYGKYFFINDKKLKTIELFFEKHGAISTFSGRMLPGVKHFISFPAGLGKMDLKMFCFYTALGGAIWNGILLSLGYFIGHNERLIQTYIKQINIVILCVMLAIGIFYYFRYRNKKD